MPRPQHQIIGFTLIELIVVISIIAVLMAVLLPVLGTARDEARSLRASAAARQLQTGHLGYALDHQGELLPGYVPPGASVKDDKGNALGPPVSQRYPWRLAAYLDGQVLGALLINEGEQAYQQGAYAVSTAPSFGYNYHYVGGDIMLPDRDRFANRYIRRLAEAIRPSSLLAFASAHLLQTPGHHRIEAPTGSPNNPGGWSEHYDETEHSAFHGYVHARHQGTAVVSFLDGHVERLTPEALRDMRLWSNQAAKADDEDWTP